MTLPLPDLSECASEPIRVPGAIQSHGRMLVLDAESHALLALSENWPQRALAERVAGALLGRLPPLLPGEAPSAIGTLNIGSQAFFASSHRTAAHLLFELEPASAEPMPLAPVYTIARQVLPLLRQAQTVEDICQLAAAEMKQLTGFGRCLVYRFDDEGHGEVLGEALDSGYESYAGHRFPASDIPAQARELYRLNHIRLIPDADYRAVPIKALQPGWDTQQLDMSQAALRSVSPVHLEYMRHMGTRASMSVSIIVQGRLWGLVSCHDASPRLLPFQTRVACEHLGNLVALQIEAREDKAEVGRRLELRQLTLQIVSHVADSDATLQQLVKEPAALLRFARAVGAAVVLDDECWCTGETPPADAVNAIARWVQRQGRDLFHTDRLAERYPAAAEHLDCAAGLLALSISQVHRHLILWFRPETVQTLQWAGNPQKAADVSDGRIHPRRSFASWKQQVAGRSRPWLQSELDTALELRQALMGIVLRRAEEMAEVANELGRVNKELEAFSYTVSHDLRAPMRHITGYVDLVTDTEGERLSARTRHYLAHVKEAAAFAGQLVDALLDFSRMGRSALKRGRVDAGALIDDLVQEFERQEGTRRIEWRIEPALPTLWADPFLLQVAVRNLMGNAVKYSRGREPAVIRVSPVSTLEGEGLEITDNGVGFQMKYADKLFGVFQRLHHSEEFEGTGIGLANVRRIVERHGGVVWAHGEPEWGASFGFTLPRFSEEN